MTELVKQARRDPSGEALEGLKMGFGDWLLRNSETSATDAAGEAFVSGRKLMKLLRNPRVNKAMVPIFSTGERGRMLRAARTAVLLENAARSGAATEGIIGDVPSGLVTLVGRVIGAQVGRVVARRTGGGTVQTPGIIASRVKQALESGVTDPAKKLLVAAIGDDSLFRALLTEAATPASQKFVRRQLNAWLAGVLFREQGEQKVEVPIQ